jgi:glutathionyl-hydroquinone reductase
MPQWCDSCLKFWRQCREVYAKADPAFSGRCTAPLLIDKAQRKSVCNESGIMLDMLYRIAAQLPDCAPFDLKPTSMAADIDKLNTFLYNKVNNAVYRCVISSCL